MIRAPSSHMQLQSCSLQTISAGKHLVLVTSVTSACFHTRMLLEIISLNMVFIMTIKTQYY